MKGKGSKNGLMLCAPEIPEEITEAERRAVPRRAFRTRVAIPRGSGSIQVADDDRGNACYVCREPTSVRFLQFNSPVRGDRMFLRLCDGCLDVLFLEHRSFNARCAVFGHEWKQDAPGIYRCGWCRQACQCSSCGSTQAPRISG